MPPLRPACGPGGTSAAWSRRPRTPQRKAWWPWPRAAAPAPAGDRHVREMGIGTALRGEGDRGDCGCLLAHLDLLRRACPLHDGQAWRRLRGGSKGADVCGTTCARLSLAPGRAGPCRLARSHAGLLHIVRVERHSCIIRLVPGRFSGTRKRQRGIASAGSPCRIALFPRWFRPSTPPLLPPSPLTSCIILSLVESTVFSPIYLSSGSLSGIDFVHT